jgi:hypothetical protein
MKKLTLPSAAYRRNQNRCKLYFSDTSIVLFFKCFEGKNIKLTQEKRLVIYKR